MLTPDYLQGAPAELEELFLRLEEDIIADICRRIAKAGYLTDSAEHQVLRLRELGAGTEYIKQKISEYSELSDEAVDRLFFDAAQTSDDFYRKAYAQANIGYTPYEYNDFFQQAVTASVNQTKGELRNFTQSMGFSYRGSNGQVRFHGAAEAYRDCLDYAYMQVMTGAVDHNTAIRNATRRLTEGGLQFVDYASGVRCHADVAARRAVLTGLSQMTGKVSEHNAAELGTDIVEVDAHAGARPDHAEWQGKWYSLSGKSKKYPSLKAVTGYGTVTGLKGANCRHDFYPVIEGISEPSYTEEELKNIDPPPFEYNGKTYTYYEATQRQRAMERSMRKTKREILAADTTDDKDSFAEKSVLLRRQKEEYGRFSKAAGISVRNERAQVGGFGHSQASRAAWAERKAKSGLDNGSRSGIINNAKTFNIFNDHDVPSNAPITTQHIVDELTSTNIGRQTLKYIENLPEQIKLTYTAKGDNIRGEQIGDEITVFLGNCKNTKWAARTVIHEVTHHKYGIGQSQWAECVCVAQELKHARNRDYLTTSELRTIISAVKEAYPEYNWRKGGVINGRKKSH